MSNSLYSLVICSHTQKHRRLTSRSLFLSPSKTPSSLRISCSRGLLASQTSTSIGKSCITRSKVDPWSYSRFLLETKSQMKSKQFRQMVKGFFPLRSAIPGQDLCVSKKKRESSSWRHVCILVKRLAVTYYMDFSNCCASKCVFILFIFSLQQFKEWAGPLLTEKLRL